MTFNFHQFAELTAFNHLFGGQETGVEAAVLVRRHRQPFAFRQRKQGFRLCQRRGKGLFDQYVFPRFQRPLRIFEVAIGMGADHHQFDLRIIQYFIEVAGEVDMGIRRRLFFWPGAAAINMRDVPAVFAMQDVRKVIAGRAFTKANKCAVQNHNAVLS